MQISKTAELSHCGTYRYRLDRILCPGRVAAMIGVNPSTADADVDDHTIRKLLGFADRLSIGHWIVGNVCAYRATDVKKLAAVEDPVGPENEQYLSQIIQSAELVIVAWGTLGKLPPILRGRWRTVVRLANHQSKSLYCWGVAQDGHPRHPLMLSYDTPLVHWQAPS